MAFTTSDLIIKPFFVGVAWLLKEHFQKQSATTEVF